MKTLAFALVVLALSGCATGSFMNTKSRYTQQGKEASTLVYTGGHGLAEEKGRKDAVEKMAVACPNGYEITDEGEYNNAAGTSLGFGVFSQKIPELYIKFHCNSKTASN